MNCYKWTVLLDDIVLGTGVKHSEGEEYLEAYLKEFEVPKYPHATNWTYEKLFCESCSGDNDVTAYQLGDRQVVKCFECRNQRFLSRNYGTVKKGDIGL